MGVAVCSNCVRKDIELSNEQVVIARSGSGPSRHGLRDTAGAVRIDAVDTAGTVFPHRARQHLGRAGKIGADLDDVLPA